MIQHLCTDWLLRQEPLVMGAEAHAAVIHKQEGWLHVSALPCDIHQPLLEQELLDDPSVGDNCFKCEWIEKRSWWFLKTFTVDEEVLASPVVDLIAEGLDAEADIFLNNTPLGHHHSQTYPFKASVSHLLHSGENRLLIRVTSGLEYYCENDTSSMQPHIAGARASKRGDDRRVMVRKPAYTYGWDWNPRIATCGITGDVRLEAGRGVAIHDACFSTLSIDQYNANIRISVEVETLHPTNTYDLSVKTAIWFDGKLVVQCAKTLFATAGVNYVDLDMTIENAALWWPNGMGGQPLYSVTVEAGVQDGADSRTFSVGIRTVELDTARIDEANRYFRFMVNGKPMFAKGGNWETPDSLYARITDEKYDKLVKEAQQAHFNMFRFNGVGAYERDAFYDACDRYGILVWNDFTFSCSVFPDNLAWFMQECEREIEHVIRRLRNHPSIALWCGSNECQWLMQRWEFWKEDQYPAPYQGGVSIYNRVMPKLVRSLSPQIPYWNSSPFGGDDLNCNEYGDRHHWHDAFMNADMNRRITPEIYDELDCKFCSEFGCIGPTKLSTIQKYYGSENITVGSKIWELHTNTFEKKTIKAAIERHYHSRADELELKDYLLYAGLFQGVTLGYAYESMRNARYNYGALLWSYNDCWGEVGWSIIDYYTTRKISYYFVKRALAHQCLIIRDVDGKRTITCFNDTLEQLSFTLEHGYVTHEGIYEDVLKEKISVPPLSRTLLASVEARQYNFTSGVYFARAIEDSGLTAAILRKGNAREHNLSKPELVVMNLAILGTELGFDVMSDHFAHAVYFDLPDDIRLSDEYFDLLPGETRHITAQADEPFAADLAVQVNSIHSGLLC
jgi:beta-mannosidase